MSPDQRKQDLARSLRPTYPPNVGSVGMGSQMGLAQVLERELTLGLVIESVATARGYVVKINRAGSTAATGVGETFSDAFRRALWRWAQD